MGFGLEATFHAAYQWLVIAVLLKMFLGFVFFVPAYVSFAGATQFQGFLVALAGPAVNGLLFLGTWLYMTYSTKKRSQEMTRFLVLFKRINGFLFVFNILPIPGFDGFHVLTNLAGMLF
jgi:Zn-dependent protease